MYHQHPVEVLEPDAAADLPETDTLLVQVTSSALFEQAHIPGAELIEPGELVCGIPPASGKLPRAEQISAALSRIGYQPQQRIIAFDDEGGGWAGQLGGPMMVLGGVLALLGCLCLALVLVVRLVQLGAPLVDALLPRRALPLRRVLFIVF